MRHGRSQLSRAERRDLALRDRVATRTAGRLPHAPVHRQPSRAGAHLHGRPGLCPDGASAISDDEQRAFLKQDRVACHSDRAKAAGMDSARKLSVDALDPSATSRTTPGRGNWWSASCARA